MKNIFVIKMTDANGNEHVGNCAYMSDKDAQAVIDKIKSTSKFKLDIVEYTPVVKSIDLTGWEPIETAPKNGTWVELINEHNGLIDIGQWHHLSTGNELDGDWNQDFGNGEMTHWRHMRGELNHD